MTFKKISASTGLVLVAMLGVQQTALAQTGQPGAGPSRWDPAASGGTLEASCASVDDWAAMQREWMARGDAWCAVEIQFGYAGTSGDIKVAVEKTRHSARSGHASVDLPANGGETTPFQFIFPCPPAGAEQLCLLYEAATADAAELRFDFVELGADARARPGAAPARSPRTPALHTAPTLLTAAPLEKSKRVAKPDDRGSRSALSGYVLRASSPVPRSTRRAVFTSLPATELAAVTRREVSAAADASVIRPRPARVPLARLEASTAF